MNREQLEEIRKRAKGARPGPWRPVQADGGEPDEAIAIWAGGDRYVVVADDAMLLADAEFIARARDDVPALLDEIDRLNALAVEPWLADLIRAVVECAEEIACNGDHEANDGCDGCRWVQLYQAVPHRLKAAAERAMSARSAAEGTGEAGQSKGSSNLNDYRGYGGAL